jgi:serine/threonine protein kinase
MDTDRQLLFGVMALQADLIDHEQFVAVCTEWSVRKRTSLADLLVERGWITPADRDHLVYLLERRLQKYGGDARASLAVLAAVPVRQTLASLEGLAIPESTPNQTPPPPGRPLDVPATIASRTDRTARYSLLHLHAQGGIGQVWRARDSELGRVVALKELRPEMVQHPDLRARFLEEARVTGQLEHPGIVPVYELAQHPENRQPFYVMRFVKGRTLSQAIQEFHLKRAGSTARPIDLLDLLNAFVAVCNTIAYAHAQGVLHRDLKGPNVLLGDFGEVVVLDWGLAKRIHHAEEPSTLPVEGASDRTLHGQILGTPAYMAPEQAEGRLDAIGPHTDVYGLGALLYEILTGRPPFDGDQTREVLRKVCQEEPVPPRQLWSGVPPPLEAISLKALAKLPAGRHESASALARDVQSWLAERTRAEMSFQQARAAVDRYYTQISEYRLLHEPGLQPLRKELLHTALEFYQKLVAQRSEDPAARAELARALYRLAEITRDIESAAQALAYLQQAIDIQDELVQSNPGVADHQRDLAASCDSLGLVYQSLGRTAEADAAYRKALDLRQRLAGEVPGVIDDRRDLAATCHNLGGLSEITGQAGRAEELYQQALRLREHLVQEHPAVSRYQNELAASHNDLAYLYHRVLGRLAPAEAAYEQALARLRTLAREQPQVSKYQRDLGDVHYNLGTLHLFVDQTTAAPAAVERALASFQQALSIQEPLAAANPAVTAFRLDLAITNNTLGVLYLNLGRVDEAGTALHRAQTLAGRLMVEHPGVIQFPYLLGAATLNLGNLAYHRGDAAETLACSEHALEALRSVLRKEERHALGRGALRNVHVQRAMTLTLLGRCQEALAEWDEATGLDDEQYPHLLRSSRALTLASLVSAAAARAALGDPEQAVREMESLRVKVALPAGSLHWFGRVFSLFATLLAGESVPGPVVESCAVLAVELLAKAQAAGFFLVPAHRDRLHTDPILDVLRTRADFRSSLAASLRS